MRTIERKIYHYDELSDQAQKSAIESMRDEISNVRIDSDSVDYYNTLNEIEQIFGVKIYDWNVNEYNSYFRFEFTHIDEETENEPMLLLRYLNTNVLPCIDNKKRYYSKTAKASRKSRILYNKSYEYCLTGCWCDSAIDNALNNIKQSVKNKFNARDFVESILEGFFEQWRNDYEFYENGKPYFA